MDATYTLITGAGSGFGRSIAQRLAPERRLLLADISMEKLDAVRELCKNPERHLLWARDLNQVSGIGEELAALLSLHKIAIEHFVHSAGVFGIQYARSADLTFVRRMFNINLFAAMEIIRPLAQARVNHGTLRTITFISALASRIGGKGYAVYAASKGAVNALALSLAAELAPTTRVNSIVPGTIETEMNKAHFAEPQFVAALRAVHPLGFGRPDDIADAVEFLSSDRARWITGQELVVDGGRSARKSPASVG